MSQLSRLMNSEDRISRAADTADEPAVFTDMSELADTACMLHTDPFVILSFVQSCLKRLWKEQASDPRNRCKPFTRWYMSLDVPREPALMYPWLSGFAAHHRRGLKH